nr:helix-turn-helix domain-containing protein [Methylomagnum ishizawai]
MTMDPDKIRAIRQQLGLTQQQFADLLGVSFVTLNRWENGQTKPSAMGIAKLRGLANQCRQTDGQASNAPGPIEPVCRLDFLGNPDEVRILIEGERLSYGHLFNPSFATEISQVDPLPHQRIAVYQRMLPQSRMRFLLADDAGAGKTIMTGLYIRESLSRRTLRRILEMFPRPHKYSVHNCYCKVRRVRSIAIPHESFLMVLPQ